MRVSILAVFVLLASWMLAACDGGGAPTATPIAPQDTPQPPPALPSPPAAYLTSADSPRVSLKAGEAITLFPARVLSRTFGRESQYRGFSTPVPTALFKLEFTNNTRRDVTKFTGALYIKDPDGNRLGVYRIEYDKPVKAGGAAVIDYTIFYNVQVRETTFMREAPLQDLKLEYRVQYINYSDGNQQEIEIN